MFKVCAMYGVEVIEDSIHAMRSFFSEALTGSPFLIPSWGSDCFLSNRLGRGMTGERGKS